MWIKIREMFISRREWNVLVRIFSLYFFLLLVCLKFHLLTFILCSLETRVEWLMPQWNVRIWVVSIYIKLWNKIISSLFVFIYFITLAISPSTFMVFFVMLSLLYRQVLIFLVRNISFILQNDQCTFIERCEFGRCVIDGNKGYWLKITYLH